MDFFQNIFFFKKNTSQKDIQLLGVSKDLYFSQYEKNDQNDHREHLSDQFGNISPPKNRFLDAGLMIKTLQPLFKQNASLLSLKI